MTDTNNAGSAPAAGAGSANQNQTGDPSKTGTTQTVPLPELMKEREQRQALQAEVEALKATVASLATGNTPGPANQNTNMVSNEAAELDALWQENPRQAMQKEIMMSMNWRDRVDAEIDSQMDSASKRYPDFHSYTSEVKKYLRNIPVNQRNRPGVIDAAYYMVKGQNAEKLIQSEVEARVKKMTSAEYTQIAGGGSSGGGAGQKATQLTPEQKGVAAAMGMSDEEYLKNMKV